jgi:hypothetical protein
MMEPGRGWSSAGKARRAGCAIPAPVREVTLHVVLEPDPGGYLLVVTSDDPAIWCDDWFATQEEAESAAAAWYGVGPEDWEVV